MAITIDPAKRETTLRDRGLEFADADAVFAGPSFSFRDDRLDYGETRIVTVGYLNGRMVLIVWTPRGADRHVISKLFLSMRKTNDREIKRFAPLCR